MARGRYHPTECSALQRVAILIPHRNRERHLLYLLEHLHPFLQRQQLDYGIYVIHQVRQLCRGLLGWGGCCCCHLCCSSACPEHFCLLRDAAVLAATAAGAQLLVAKLGRINKECLSQSNRH